MSATDTAQRSDWRSFGEYVRPHRRTLVAGGALSLATTATGLALKGFAGSNPIASTLRRKARASKNARLVVGPRTRDRDPSLSHPAEACRLRTVEK